MIPKVLSLILSTTILSACSPSEYPVNLGSNHSTYAPHESPTRSEVTVTDSVLGPAEQNGRTEAIQEFNEIYNTEPAESSSNASTAPDAPEKIKLYEGDVIYDNDHGSSMSPIHSRWAYAGSISNGNHNDNVLKINYLYREVFGDKATESVASYEFVVSKGDTIKLPGSSKRFRLLDILNETDSGNTPIVVELVD